jgi:integrase
MKGSIIKRGTRSYRLKYDLPRGPTGERRIAYRTFRGAKSDAEKALRAILAAQDKGVVVDPSKITVGQYLSSWLEDKAPQTVGAKTLERYEGLVRNQITPHLGNIRLQALRPADIERWLQVLIKEGRLSSRSIRHAHGAFRVALQHATRMETIPRNVAKVVQPPPLTRKEIQILTADQLSETLNKLAGHPLHPIAAFALGTGARRGEIAALRWSDIDLDNARVRIERALEQTKGQLRVKQPKTAAGRRKISLPAFTVTALRDYRREQLELRLKLGIGQIPKDAPLFGDLEGNWLEPHLITNRWRRAIRNRKLPPVTFHALRHTHASALINKGLDVVAVSKRLGHASPALTLSVYAHLFKRDDSAAAAAIDAVLADGDRS